MGKRHCIGTARTATAGRPEQPQVKRIYYIIQKGETTMRKTLAVILCALMILPLAFVGISAAEPTVITTAEQFAKIEKDGNYKLGADITVSSTIVYIEKQIKDGKEVDRCVGLVPRPVLEEKIKALL